MSLESEKIEQIEKRIEQIEFRQQLLFDNDEVSRLLFEYNITKQQYNSIMDIMDIYRTKIGKKEDVSYHSFENEIYKVIPEHDGDYHMCEYIARAFMDAGRWEEVFKVLYSKMPKYRSIMDDENE